MRFTDLHVHTNFSDGTSTAEENVRQAIAYGMDTIGFSDHSYTSFCPGYCMAKERIAEYRKTIGELKKKYEGQIRILCGIEQDYYSDLPAEDFDFVIGSVHFVRVGGEYLSVDHSPEFFRDAVNRYFGGDAVSYAQAYYELESQVADRTRCDIVGHFDLIAKFNENGEFFDENDPRYVHTSRAAADQVLKTQTVFEINSGAISRGFRVTPYPSIPLAEYIYEHGGKFLLESDSHLAKNLCFQFDALYESCRKYLIDADEFSKLKFLK